MSVPASKRGHGKFEVLIETKKLAAYTIRILQNEKYFDPKFYTAMGAGLISTAKNIHILCYRANCIRVGEDPEKAKLRKKYQEAAINECDSLAAQIELAQPIYHLATKRVKYWIRITGNTKDIIRRWKDSDRKRYADLLKEA